MIFISCFMSFISSSFIKQFMLERTMAENLKSKHFDGVFGMLWFFGIKKNMLFCACEYKSYVAPTKMAKHADISVKLTLVLILSKYFPLKLRRKFW